jgi:hypothetical protein
LFPVWLHGDFHPGNALLVPDRRGAIESMDLREGQQAADGSRRWSIRVIDVADAVMEQTNERRAPMAFDYVSFESVLKVTSLLSGREFEKPNTVDHSELIEKLREDELAIWDWCEGQLQASASQMDASPRWKWRPPRDYPKLHNSAFRIVACWRHMALHQLCEAARRAAHSTVTPAGWSPLSSYAQALYFYTLGYLEYLKVADEKYWLEVISCVVPAAVAAGHF